MKKGIEENLIESRNIYRLTDAEKKVSFEKIEAFVRANPLPMRSPFTIHHLLLKRMSYYTMVAILFTVTSISLYAEGSLPGEYLYPVKVEVNDSLKVFSAFTAESRAETHINIINQRIQEIDEASEKGTLDVEALEYAAASLDEHTESVAELIAETHSNGNIIMSLEISENLDASTTIEIPTASVSTGSTSITIMSMDEATTSTSTKDLTNFDIASSTNVRETADTTDLTEEVEENIKSSKEKIEKYIIDQKKHIEEKGNNESES